MEPLHKDLLREKSLLDIWRASWGIPWSGFNVIVVALSAALSTAYAIAADAGEPLIAAARQVADHGLDYGASILGFLLAGFTIFATVGDKRFLLRMAREPSDVPGLNWLKLVFFAFIRVFILYLVFMGICLMIRLFCQPGGLAGCIVPTKSYAIRHVLGGTAFVVLATYSVLLLVTLKSFVFDTYHSLMSTLLWEDFTSEQEHTEVTAKPEPSPHGR